MSFDELPEFLTISDVSNILNVHQNTLRNWEKEGFIDAVRIGKRRDRRYRRETVWKLLREGHHEK